MERLYMIITISDRENEEKVIDIFRENNVYTTDVVLGTGTAPMEILDYLYLSPNEKAVVLGVVTEAGLLPLLRSLRKKMYMDRAGSGIVAAVPLNSIGGRRSLEYILDGQTLKGAPRKNTDVPESEEKMAINTDYELIFVVANEGYSDLIMEAARQGGAGGGTVIKAKGTGAEYTKKFFGFSIAEEKEIHLLVTEAGSRDSIMKSIMADAGLDSKAQSIVFSLPVSNVIGLSTPE